MNGVLMAFSLLLGTKISIDLSSGIFGCRL